MSALLRKHQSDFHKMLALLTALVFVTLTGSLTLLWQRQQIEVTAASLREKEKQMEVEERRLRFIDTKIARIHQPLYLQEQVARLQLDLAPPKKDQIVYLQASPETLRIARQEIERTEKEPFRYTLDLAVLEPLKKVR